MTPDYAIPFKIAGRSQLERFWPVFVWFPVLYGVFNLSALFAFNDNYELLQSYESVGFLFKPVLIPCFPVLFYLLAKRVAAKPSRWRVLAATWSIVGAIVVLFFARYHSVVAGASNSAAFRRLWPDAPVYASDIELVESLGARYNVTAVVATELIAVVVVAFVASLITRWLGTSRPELAFVVTPASIMFTLLLYVVYTRYAFILDFDFFVGDAVLGSTFADLLFPPAPFDMVGGACLGLAAATMGVFLAIWPPPSVELKNTTRDSTNFDPESDGFEVEVEHD